jgi:hypothetical protein
MQRFCRTASQWPIISDGIANGIEGGYKNPGRVKTQRAKAAFKGSTLIMQYLPY